MAIDTQVLLSLSINESYLKHSMQYKYNIAKCSCVVKPCVFPSYSSITSSHPGMETSWDKMDAPCDSTKSNLELHHKASQ